MQNLFFILFVSLLLEACCLGDPYPPSIAFKPIRKASQSLLVGENGIYPKDSVHIFYLNSDSILRVNEFSVFQNSISMEELPVATSTFYIDYGTFDRDTMVIEAANRRKRNAVCGYKSDFIYNGETICIDCNKDSIFTVNK